MFKKLLTALLVCFTSAAIAKTETLTLTKENTVILKGVVDDSTVVKAQSQILKLDRKLPKGQPIYLYLDTPGGSISAGEDLILLCKSLKREVKTVTSFAASMGFVMAQNLGERLVLPGGILMSHRAKIGLEGQIPGEFNTRSDFFMKLITEEEKLTAARLDMDLKEYRELIHDEYWTYGANAVSEGAADKVVNVECGADMKGTYKEVVQVFIFEIQLTFSECPLVRGPTAIGPVDPEKAKFSPIDALRVPQVLHDLYNSQEKFVEDYIVTNEYKKVFK